MTQGEVSLNRAQGLALALDRNISLIAGAGTGKTEVLSRRFLAILDKNRTQDWTAPEVACPPAGLVAMTYTRKAAGEMRERIARDIGKRIRAARDEGDADSYAYWMRMRRQLKHARITTIHGLCADIVLDHALLLGIDPDATVLEEVDQRLLVQEAIDDTLRDPPQALRDELARLFVTSRPLEVRKALAALVADRVFANDWSEGMAGLDIQTFIRTLRQEAAPCGPDEARVRMAVLADMVRPVVTSPLRPAKGPATDFLDACHRLLLTDAGDDDAVLDAYCTFLLRFKKKSGDRGVYAKGQANNVLGKKSDWAPTGDDRRGIDLFEALREEVHEDAERFDGLPGDDDRELLRLMRALAGAYGDVRERYRQKKLRRRALDYPDLEELALVALEKKPGVLEEVRRRVRHLMVDEFQDTNDTQWRLIRLLASDDPVPTEEPPPWAIEREVPLEPALEDAFVSAASLFGVDDDEDLTTRERDDPHDLGVLHPELDTESQVTEAPDVQDDRFMLGDDRLFIVGDAKQSIYAFRGADVTVYQGSRRAVKAANDQNGTPHRPLRSPDGTEVPAKDAAEARGEIELDENFRSLPHLVQFANHLFDGVLRPMAGPAHAQHEAAPGPLSPRRAPLAPDHAGTVSLLAVPDKTARYGDTGLPDRDRLVTLHPKEAQYLRLAQHIAHEVTGDRPLPVFDPRSKEVRPARLSDIAILLPSRTHLKALERALSTCDLGYVVTGGRGFWARPEVWDQVNLVGFLADTHRDVALAALLRSAFFAWTDDAVLALTLDDAVRPLWKKLERAAAGTSAWRPPVGFEGAPPHEVYAILQAAHEAAGTTPTHRIIERVHAATGYPAALASDERPVQAQANVTKFIALVRDREARQGIQLPRLVRDLRHRVDEEVDEAEADIPDDTPGIRILTVHAAKGLEFPIVYLPDLDRPFPTDNLGDARGYNKGILAGMPLVTTKVRDADGEDVSPVLHRLLAKTCKERSRSEQARLLYVAVTRARDHLFLVAASPRLFADKPHKQQPPARQDATCWRDWVEDVLGLDAATYLDAYDQEDHRKVHPVGKVPFVIDCTPPRLHDGPQQDPRPVTVQTAEPLLDLPQTGPSPHVPPFVLHPSSVETYRLCPARFRHHHIEGLPDLQTRGTDLTSPDRGRLLGSFVHRVLETTHDGGDIPSSLAARIRASAREHGLEPDGLLRDVLLHVGRAREALGPIPSLKELVFDHAWTDGIRTRGVIDGLRPDGDGWILFDTKSDRPGKDLLRHAQEAGYDAQLAVYRVVVERHAGPVRAARLVFTSTGETLDVAPDPTIGILDERLSATRRMTHDDEAEWERLWPRTPADPSSCLACGFHRKYGGPCAGTSDDGGRGI